MRDLNGNGYIDGNDLLADARWSDGRDTDGNGEVDDLVGVNFRGDGIRNQPTDPSRARIACRRNYRRDRWEWLWDRRCRLANIVNVAEDSRCEQPRR